MKNPSRFTFDAAAEHVYTLLLKKDCYPRFIRSDQYRNLLTAGAQPLQKKRYPCSNFSPVTITLIYVSVFQDLVQFFCTLNNITDRFLINLTERTFRSNEFQ